MQNTSLLNLPYILPSQAQKHVTHNEAIRALDALVQLSAADRDRTDPPAAAAEGDRHLVAVGATGAWAGKDGQLAAWQDGAWAFFQPREGWLSWVAAENLLMVFDGADWKPAASGGAGGDPNPVALVGVNATADAVNRLAVASEASLFSHEGAGHQVKVNKAAAADTASLLFQSGWAGRAEMGLTGDDDFHVKVSADGANWNEAIVIDRATGAVSLPNTAAAGGAPQELGGVWRPGRQSGIGWMTHPANGALFTSSIGWTMFAPLRIGEAGQVSKMSCTVHSGAAAGQSVRMALYRAAADRMPGELAAVFGSADCSAAGVKTLEIAPLTLEAGLCFAMISASSGALVFRSGQYAIDNGAGFVSAGNIFQAAIGRIVYLAPTDPWPPDLTGHTIGTGTNQLQLTASIYCPTMVVW